MPGVLRNPIVTCDACGSTMTSNLLRRHQRTHDPEHVEAKRQRKNARQRTYARTDAGRATRLRKLRSAVARAGARRRTSRRKQTEQGRLAYQAHDAVKRAIKAGRLIRRPCRECGDPVSFAHHHLGYAPEHRLDVEWLCLNHHMEAHGRVAA